MTAKARSTSHGGVLLLLGLALLAGGCEEEPLLLTGPGPVYAVEGPPPGKALIHVYWPSVEQGRRQQVSVASCCTMGDALMIGGYLPVLVAPGPERLDISRTWNLGDTVFGTSELASLKLDVKEGTTYFVRLEQEPGPLTSRFNLRPVTPAAADHEIRRCRKMVPLSEDEIARQLAKRR